MLDARQVRTDPQAVAKLLLKRGFVLDVAAIEKLEAQRKTLQTETEALQNERNTKSKNIGKAKSSGQDVAPLMAEVEHLRGAMEAKKAALDAVQAEFDAVLQRIPNIPAAAVPTARTRPPTSNCAAGAPRNNFLLR